MRIIQVRNGFEFNYNAVIANEICTICLFQFMSIIIYLQIFLLDKWDAPLCKFNSQSFLVTDSRKSDPKVLYTCIAAPVIIYDSLLRYTMIREIRVIRVQK